MDIKCIWQGKNILGESPIWHPGEQALYWADLLQAQIHRLDPVSGQHTSWQMPEKIGCITLRQSGGLLAVFHRKIAYLELPSGKISWSQEFLMDEPKVRFNDGKCDRQGRLWVGTADLQEQHAIAGLYRFEMNKPLYFHRSGFIVANGIAWSLDNTLMYHADSEGSTIHQYQYNFTDGMINEEEIFRTVPREEGLPDGLTVDSEGFIWSAHWAGARITRYHPSGRIDRVIEMPVQKPTSCCFGGKDLNTLFVTSASLGVENSDPLSGSLFAIDVGVKGLLETPFKDI